jgi:hypothetical protein
MKTPPIKCVGCYDLKTEKLTLAGKPLVVYNCATYFPYACALSGLLHPGKDIFEAVDTCPKRIDRYCILCPQPPSHGSYGKGMVFICKTHDLAWRKWLDEHPDRQKYLAPHDRLNKPNWIEVFREFIEEMRNPVKEG